ncbi:MAG TPA: hypothetical protein VFS08_08490 [Gemmatimonadaceae bacterium]|nr:hypothetical protein [Gemmatimonadaceae bacterium]
MRSDRLGTILLVGGVAVGVVASLALAVGFAPSRLPAALLDIAAYKLTFLAAGGLMVVGAMVRRHAARDAAVRRDDPAPGTHDPRPLAPPPAREVPIDTTRHSRTGREHVERPGGRVGER